MLRDAKRNITTTIIKEPSRQITPKRKLYFLQNPSVSDFVGQSMVTLSYDDGMTNNYEIVLPLHEQYGVPATFNIIASRVQDTQQVGTYMNAKQILDAHRRGIEIASHSYYHDAQLTSKTDQEVHFEMAESKTKLAQIVGSEVETIAIPFSAYDDRVRSIAMQHYKGVRVHSNELNDIPPDDRYWLYSAIAPINTTTFDEIKAKIDQAVTLGKWCIIMMHGVLDAPEYELGTYYVTAALLERVLEYIKTFDKDVLLPVNTRDGLRFSLGTNY
jgi:peptidoglycan/xylan/chitin deacetylase (PgdA/CDA1 family)